MGSGMAVWFRSLLLKGSVSPYGRLELDQSLVKEVSGRLFVFVVGSDGSDGICGVRDSAAGFFPVANLVLFPNKVIFFHKARYVFRED